MAEVPTAGPIVDVGCGHGLLALALAASSADRDVVGLDIDQAKLSAARAAAGAAPALDNVRFASADPLEPCPGTPAAVCVVDVLYLLERPHQEALVRTLARRLAPAGRLVIKEMAPAPRWKHRWMHAQEVLATRVASITASEDGVLCFTPPETLGAWMRDEGLSVTARAVDRGRPYPHHLLVGTARG